MLRLKKPKSNIKHHNSDDDFSSTRHTPAPLLAYAPPIKRGNAKLKVKHQTANVKLKTVNRLHLHPPYSCQAFGAVYFHQVNAWCKLMNVYFRRKAHGAYQAAINIIYRYGLRMDTLGLGIY